MKKSIHETLVKNITRKRKELNLKISDLARKSGVSDKTLRKILDGTTLNPTITNISLLAKALNCTTSELLEEGIILTPKDVEMLSLFNKLSEHGQMAVVNAIKAQIENKVVLKQVPLFDQKVSAGLGNFLDSDNYEYISVLADDMKDSKGYALQISGDSMEPILRDQDYVLIEPTQTLNKGEIGVFILNGDSFIKQLGDGELISINEDYPPIEYSDFDDVKVVGRFIKKLKIQDDF